MPFLKNGGLFLPTSLIATKAGEPAEDYQINSNVCLLLQLFDDSQQYFCVTKVVWISPAQVCNGQSRGIGLHFGRSEAALNAAIKAKLKGYEKTANLTQTL